MLPQRESAGQTLLMSAILMAKKKKPYSPVYLAHEPPHEPWPLHETVLVIARHGMHSEDDGLGTLPLGPHYHRTIIVKCQNPSPGAIGRRQNRLQGARHSHHSSDFLRFMPIKLHLCAPSVSGGSNEANDPFRAQELTHGG
jgi:hypothetical protein